MGKIHALPQHIAELIAAGEVVERPASVVKELVENAIDAGASKITVEIQRGGISYIRVTDNGSGIAREDVETAFCSHATSKLREEKDLESIATLGFRGEALPSIAAVARVELLTAVYGALEGTRYCVEGGQRKALEEAGCPVGTTLVVRDLFFNTPARMKFLKKDVTEANAVASVLDKIALSHPEISFRLLRDEKEILLTPGDSQLLSAIHAIFGRQFAEGLLPVSYTMNHIAVSGYIARPLSARPNRSMQHFFINGRLVKSRTCLVALEEAYKNAMMVGKFPSCVLHLQVPLSQVDVNVHPAKIEVRFSDEKQIFDSVYYACKSTLHEKDMPKPASLVREVLPAMPEEPPGTQLKMVEKPPAPKPDFWQHQTISAKPMVLQDEGVRPKIPITPTFRTEIVSAPEPPPTRILVPPEPILAKETGDIPSASQHQETQPVQSLGELFGTYLLGQQGDQFWLVDKHAAHERILFEELRAQTQAHSQMLLKALPVRVTKEEQAALLESGELLAQAGFELDDFGDGTLLIRAVPLHLAEAEISAILVEIAGYLLQHKTEIMPEKLDWIYHSVACRAAIKAGDPTSEYERRQFLERVLSMPDLRYCPHGRPVTALLTKGEIQKLFKRT